MTFHHVNACAIGGPRELGAAASKLLGELESVSNSFLDQWHCMLLVQMLPHANRTDRMRAVRLLCHRVPQSEVTCKHLAALLLRLQQDDWGLRRAALQVLSCWCQQRDLMESGGVRMLLAFIYHTNYAVRLCALEALEMVEEELLTEHLSPLLTMIMQHADWEVRARVSRLLGGSIAAVHGCQLIPQRADAPVSVACPVPV